MAVMSTKLSLCKLCTAFKSGLCYMCMLVHLYEYPLWLNMLLHLWPILLGNDVLVVSEPM